MKLVAFAGLLVFGITGALGAQGAPNFEAASVKRISVSDPRLPRVVAVSGEHLTAPYATLRDLIQAAYGIEANQLVGGPGWIDTDRFDINATIRQGASPVDAQRMLQGLLAERFGLATHPEKRDLPVYELQRPEKLGPQITIAGPECKPLASPPGIPAPPPPPPPPGGAGPMTILNQPPGSKCGNVMFNGFFSMRAVPMVSFVTNLSRQIRRLIVDHSGLTGIYDIDLSFLPDAGPMQFNGQAINADAPSLTTAVREQLGMKLESTRAPVDVIVIERVSPPTGN